MPSAEFFARFGFYHVRSFLDPEECARLGAEMRRGAGVPATVRGRGDSDVLNENARRAVWVRVAPESLAMVSGRVQALRPELERHFSVTLNACDEPDFLRYMVGDFYVGHRDQALDPSAPADMRVRRVSVVIFINGEGNDADSYGGGALTFAGLFDDARFRGRGVPLVGEPGLLFAFRADVLHSVSPVTRGERYTVVTWLS